MRTPSLLLLAAALAAASCAKTSSVGTSGHKPPDNEQPTAPARPKLPSLITAGPNTSLGYNQPILGDVDGDGFDDFLVQGVTQNFTGATEGTTATYLFYGKESFAPQIATNQADAIFESAFIGAWALGDIDGDGLADFSLAQADNSFDLVFGDRARYAGHYPAHTTGTTWSGTPLPSPFASGLQTLLAVRGAGDVNGDGVNDLLVTDSAQSTDEQIESPIGFGLVQTDHLVLGHSSAWASGAWDPSTTAAAALGTETVRDAEHPEREIRRMLLGLPIGDLDGDGYADLVGVGRDALFVFYGGERRLQNRLDAANSDAMLTLPKIDEDAQRAEPIGFFYDRRVISIGDLDGDGSSDLGVYDGSELQITYGTKARWAGTLELARDYVIEVSNVDEVMLGAAGAGDVDSDSIPDLALMTAVYPSFDIVAEDDLTTGSSQYARSTLYLLRGTGIRATGVHRLNSDDIRRIGNETDPGSVWGPPSIDPLPTEGAVLSMAGDIDGDGSCDILAGSSSNPTPPNLPQASVILIPSTPRAPD